MGAFYQLRHDTMKIFLTGANGFVGRHLTRHLSAAGHEVLAVVRPGAPADLPAALLLRANLETPGDWQAALASCDAVIHLAARYRIGGVDRREMAAANIEATRNVLEAAWRAGVGRIIHVSSTAALGETGAGPGDENSRHNGRFRSFYEQTKHVGHGLAEAMQQRGAPLIIAIPGGIFGPGDQSDLAQVLGQFVHGKLPMQVASESRFQLCPVEAVCDGLRRVVEHGVIGRNYLLTGATVGMAQLIERAAAVAGLPLPKKVQPASLRWPARICDALRPLGIRLPLSKEALQVMDGSSYLYSSARAESELGWPWLDHCSTFGERFDEYVRTLLPTATGSKGA